MDDVICTVPAVREQQEQTPQQDSFQGKEWLAGASKEVLAGGISSTRLREKRSNAKNKGGQQAKAETTHAVRLQPQQHKKQEEGKWRMSSQHGFRGFVSTLGAKFFIFCSLYCFSLWRLHSVLSLEKDKQNLLGLGLDGNSHLFCFPLYDVCIL